MTTIIIQPTVSGINDREGGAQEPEGLGVAHAIEAGTSWILPHPSLRSQYAIHDSATYHCMQSRDTDLHRVCLENMSKETSANPWPNKTNKHNDIYEFDVHRCDATLCYAIFGLDLQASPVIVDWL